MDDDLLFEYLNGTARKVLERHLLYKSQFNLPPEDIQDIVQEAVLRFIRKRPYPDPVLPWLYTVVDNLFIDHWRKQTAQTRRMSSDDVEALPELPHQKRDNFLELSAFADVFVKLPELQQHVLDDTAMGYTQKEIALRYNIPETKVAYLWREAKKQIRRDPKLSAMFSRSKK